MRVRVEGFGGGDLLYSFLLLSSLESSDSQVYEPSIRALLRTASHFCEVVVLEVRISGGDLGALVEVNDEA